MLLIGLDAASQRARCGYALGRWDGRELDLLEAGLLDTPDCSDALVEHVLPALKAEERALIAIDAPLGWPQQMGQALQSHAAGKVLDVEKNSLFRRHTDVEIKRRLGRMPLEVGADRIARAAHSALAILQELRDRTGNEIPLAWTPQFAGIAAIEVYPAATLTAWSVAWSGYKELSDAHGVNRQAIAKTLEERMPKLRNYLSATGDVFDACLCLLAGSDFLLGHAIAPVDRSAAEKEGWIWARSPL